MTPNPVHSLLDQIEAHLSQCTQAMLNQTQGLAESSAALHASMVSFSKLLKPAEMAARCDPALKRRLQQIAALMAAYRANLIRQSVVVDRALAALVPATRHQTYSGASGAYGRNPYASAGRQSGEFRMSTA